MTHTRRDDAWAVDVRLPDHFPACPRCGNLCGRLARICADCGTRLYEPLDPPTSPVVTSSAVKPSARRGNTPAAKPSESLPPPQEKDN